MKKVWRVSGTGKEVDRYYFNLEKALKSLVYAKRGKPQYDGYYTYNDETEKLSFFGTLDEPVGVFTVAALDANFVVNDHKDHPVGRVVAYTATLEEAIAWVVNGDNGGYGYEDENVAIRVDVVGRHIKRVKLERSSRWQIEAL